MLKPGENMNPEQSPANTDDQTVPTEWPDSATGKKIYPFSRRAVAANWPPLLFLAILTSIFDISNRAGERVGPLKGMSIWLALLLMGASYLIGSAHTAAILQSIDKQKVNIGKAFDTAARQLWKIIVATILNALIVAVGLLLLIVPGIIFAIRLSLTNYYILDRGYGPIEALNASWKAVSGNMGKILQIVSMYILLVLLCITIIGIPFALYFMFMYSAAMGIAYRYLSAKEDARQETETTSATPAN